MAQEQEAVFRRVKENFQRVEEFGWYSPRTLPSCSFDVCPKDKDRHGLGYHQAAVLFLISHYRGELHVLITQRSQLVRTHRGQQCLPGGNRDDKDATPVDTALREAEEEVGLDPGLVEVVSVLPPSISGWDSLICVTPVVSILKCTVDELNLVCNPDEVAAVTWIPIRTFLESNTFTLKSVLWKGVPYPLANFNYINPETGRSCRVWGLTARICTNASAIALNQEPSFMHTGNYSVFDVHRRGNGTVTVMVRSIALTSKDVEQWKIGFAKTKPVIPIDRWPNTIPLTSKL